MRSNTDMTRKTALVVGGTRGIGKETARGLAEKGAVVVIVGRTREAGEATARGLGAGVEFVAADVSLMSEVRRVVEVFRRRHNRLDVLVQSADVLRTKRLETAEGLEVSFATNYLSRFLFVGLLLDLLKESAPARIVHVAAAGLPGKLDLGNVPPGPKTSSFAGHNLGQRANDVYGVELASRLAETGVSVSVVNPGMVDTDLRRNMQTGLAGRLMVRSMEAVFRSRITTPEGYSREVLRLATSPDIADIGGVLFNRKGESIRVRPAVGDTETRRRLWEISACVTGLAEGSANFGSPTTETTRKEGKS